jgi:hypothetical protein
VSSRPSVRPIASRCGLIEATIGSLP